MTTDFDPTTLTDEQLRLALAEYETAHAAYCAESQRMWAELENIVRERHALVAAQRVILANR